MLYIKEQIVILTIKIIIQKLQHMKNDIRVDKSDNSQICFCDYDNKDQELINYLIDYLGLDWSTIDDLDAIDTENYTI